MSDAPQGSDGPTVDAAPPASPFRVRGTDHVTIVGSNVEDTVAF
jgi:hypothetical protein